jgi:hypothetical protein
VQELALAGSQVAATTTPRRPTASVAHLPPQATACSNFDEFLPSQVQRESNVNQSLQSLHSVHIISRTKINLNYKKPRTFFNKRDRS